MAKTPDFRAYFGFRRGLYLVLTPDLKIVDASPDYVDATLLWCGDVRGEYMFDVFPDNPRDPHDGASNLKASFDRVLKHGVTDRMPVQRYDIQDQAFGSEAWIEKYWAPLNRPIRPKGSCEITYIIHEVVDKTLTVNVARWIKEQLIANEGQQLTLEQMLNQNRIRHKRLGATRTKLEELLRTRADSDALARELAMPFGIRDICGHFRTGDRVLTTGSYDVFHHPQCALLRGTVALSAGSTFPPCDWCRVRVLYRFRGQL